VVARELVQTPVIVTSDVPARLDRLPWSGWHRKVVVALGVAWALDGLEVTIVGSIASVLGEPTTLGLSESQIGAAASAYLAGAILGALVFGRLADVWGRKRLFMITLSLYLTASLLTAASFDFVSFAVCRLLTGAGIGGEYSAINSAIDELLPARVRGRADLAINATYWLGAALGGALSLVLLNPAVLPHAVGWRACFALGALLGVAILLVRTHVPESPRWLLLHGRIEKAEATMRSIEHEVERAGATLPAPRGASELGAEGAATIRRVLHVFFRTHARRTVLGLVLMATQAFAYNAVFFTYALVLARFHGVGPEHTGLHILALAFGNLLGPWLLGGLFDTWGRRLMITLTYGLSAVLMAGAAYAFARGWLTGWTQTLAWSCVFFFASAAASSAYLTVSELFPVELRGMAIAVFFAIGTALGGLLAPLLFGVLVQTGERSNVSLGYLLGAVMMGGAALVASRFAVAAEGKSLEELSANLR
jgi:MFS family permease